MAKSKFIVTLKGRLECCLSKTLSRYQYKYLYNQLRYQFKKYNLDEYITIKRIANYGCFLLLLGTYIEISYSTLILPILLDLRYCKEAII